MSFSICRRRITSRFALVAPRFHPSFNHILVKDDEDRPEQVSSELQVETAARKFDQNFRCFGLSGQSHGGNRFLSPFSTSLLGFSFGRFYSSSPGQESENISYMTDVAELISDESSEVVASQAPLINEVAIAAADSSFPVAALQYFIDGIHSFTGFNWWASIVIATLLIRTATLPLQINILKSSAIFSQLRPQFEEIGEQMRKSKEDNDPEMMKEGQMKMMALMKEHNVSPFAPLKGLFIQAPIFVSFFFAISNMVEKVPSFKTGGVLWFTDLTTADSFYVFPVLTAASFLLTIELNTHDGMEGNKLAGTMKMFSRLLAVLFVPFTLGFPKAIFCYWITSNLFSLCYSLVIRQPQVKAFLGIPDFVVSPSSGNTINVFFGRPDSVIGEARAVLERAKKSSSISAQSAATDQTDKTSVNLEIGKDQEVLGEAENSSLSGQMEGSADQKSSSPEQKITSSEVISQRIQNLEDKVKGRENPNKENPSS